MNDSLKKYMSTLFDPGEPVWIIDHYQSTKVASDQDDVFFLNRTRPSRDGYLVGVNPAKKAGDRHGKEMVGQYRNLLIEFDDLSLQMQSGLIQKRGLPYSTMTYSGGKSFHVVISMTSPFSSEEAYKEAHGRISFAFADLIDKQTNKVSIFTRLPGFYRITEQGVRKQSLIEIRERVSHEELDVFLAPTAKEYFKSMAMKEASNSVAHGEATERFNSDGSQSSDWQSHRIRILENYVRQNQCKKSSAFQFRLQCPLCAENGGDTGKDHLSINLEEGLWHCFAGCDRKDLFRKIKNRNMECDEE